MKRNAFLFIAFIFSSIVITNPIAQAFNFGYDEEVLLGTPFTSDSLKTQNFESYLSHAIFDQIADETVECIAAGDADNDGDTDIVVGTRPYGLVILYENVGNYELTLEYDCKIIANYSNYLGVIPVIVRDITIGDLEGTGNNSILLGVTFFAGQYKGHVIRFDKLNSNWQQTEILNGESTPIISGVYSVAVGEIGTDSTRVVVVGEGFDKTFHAGNITVYTKDDSIWHVEDILQTEQNSIDVCIGDYSSVLGGNEIIYCIYTSNSTLGYLNYETGVYYNNFMANYTVTPENPTNYTSFMNVQLGDLQGNGQKELAIAIDSYDANTDRIVLYNETGETTIVSNFETISDELLFGDFDNDGKDEIVYAYTNTTMFPTTRIMYYDWNGTAGESIFVEEAADSIVPALCIGDFDDDTDFEMMYGTANSGWLVVWDYVTIPSIQSISLPPMVSLIAGPFSFNYRIRFFGWNTQDVNCTVYLPPELTTESSSALIGNVLYPGFVSQNWNITALDYGYYRIDVTTNTTYAGDFQLNTTVLVTDLEVSNTEASSTTAPIAHTVTISGYVVYIHDKTPVHNAVVYLDGESIRITDELGFFSFGVTNYTIGISTYNITASYQGAGTFDDSAIFKIIEIEWVPFVSEFYSVFGVTTSLFLLIITQIIVFFKIRRKKH